MNILQDLKPFQAIQIDDASLLIALPRGSFVFCYEDRPERTIEVTEHFGRQIRTWVPQEVFAIRKVLMAERFTNVHTGVELDSDEVLDQRQQLIDQYSSAIVDVDEEDDYVNEMFVFDECGRTFVVDDLDQEYQLRVALTEFDNTWRKLPGEVVVTREPVELVVIGSMEDTGSRFIETPLSIGKCTWAGFYRVDTSAVAADEAKTYLLSASGGGFENSKHSNILYLKYRDRYVFSSKEELTKPFLAANASTVVSSLEQARQVETDIRKYVRAMLDAVVNPGFTEVSKVQTLRELTAISQLAASVPGSAPKSKFIEVQLKVIARLNKLYDRLLMGDNQ